MKIRSALFALTLLLLCGCPKNGPGPDTAKPGPGGATGTWGPSGAHTHGEALACTQRWTCDCKAITPAPGCRIIATPDASTTGVCAADEGPPAACTRCMAMEPADACACPSTCP